MLRSDCLAEGWQKPSFVHWTKLLYELHRHLVWITHTFTEVFVQAFPKKLNFCLQKLRWPELAVFLPCFNRQPKWQHFSPGNLTATSCRHAPASRPWMMSALLHVALKRLISCRNQWLPSFSQHSSSSYTDLLTLNWSVPHYTPTSVISGKEFSCTGNCYRIYFTFLSHCCTSTCPQAAWI